MAKIVKVIGLVLIHRNRRSFQFRAKLPNYRLQPSSVCIVKEKMKNPHPVRGRELQNVDGYQELQQNLRRNTNTLQENL